MGGTDRFRGRRYRLAEIDALGHEGTGEFVLESPESLDPMVAVVGSVQAAGTV